MHSNSSIVLALCAFVAPVLAQEAPPPSAKLKAFADLVGHWQGKGQVVQMEGQPASPWTATLSFQPVLGGYFFQEDVEVQVGAPTPLQMRTIYGWDAENERYVTFGLGNTGESNYGTVHFPSSGTMVASFAGDMQGEAATARVVWEFGDGKMTFKGERANGAGPWFTEVEGAFQKIDAAPKSAAEASFMGAPVANQITELATKMVGTYELTGSMTMMPGMPEMKVQGSETVGLVFGGHAVLSVVEGTADDGPLYIGQNYMVWNQTDGCYEFVMFDNMGACGKSQGWMVDDSTVVSVFAGRRMGQPVSERGLLKIGEHGVESWTAHTMVGAGAPMQSFHATYRRKAD